MIYQWLCKRRTLVDFIVNRKPVDKVEIQLTDKIKKLNNSTEDIILIWDCDPTEVFSLPNAIVVDEKSTIDFLAWITTYFRQIRPFTAQCRVLTPSLAQILSQRNLSSSTPNVSSAIIGLILAEGVAYSVGRTDLNRLPFSAFARTLSFSLARGSQIYAHSLVDRGIILDETRNGWSTARDLSNQPLLVLSSSEIRDVFAIILGVVENDRLALLNAKSDLVLFEALRGLKENGRIPSGVLAKISESYQRVSLIIGEMDGPRESRVKAVENVIQDLIKGPIETRRRRAFLAGYIVSLVQPGSLDHFPLLSAAINELPECFLWYGACAGLIPETSVDNYGNGLGMLLRRELERTSYWLDRPRCDIALTEMAVLFRNREDVNFNIRTVVTGTLEVEISPMVSTTVKWADLGEVYPNDKNSLTAYQKPLFGDDMQLRQDVLQLLDKIEESTKSLYAIRKQVEMKFGEKSTRGKWRK